MLNYDEKENLCWILYSDGGSEEFDADEARQGMQDHKQHMQPATAVSNDDVTDEQVASDSRTADSTVAVVSQAQPGFVLDTSQSLNSGARSYTEMSTAIAALTEAAESLAAVAESLAAQSQQQQQQQQAMFLRQQQQQLVLVSMQQQQQQQLRVQQQLLHQHFALVKQQQWQQYLALQQLQ